MNPLAAMAVLVLAASASAAETVRICTRTGNLVPAILLTQAQVITSRILHEAGVVLEWRFAGLGYCSGALGPEIVQVEFKELADRQRPGSMAYVHPYGPRVVVVMFSRIRERSSGPQCTVALLAHVMAHELTHVLQHINRHSDFGLMKERWSREDVMLMVRQPLRLSAGDIQLIQLAMHARDAVGVN